MSMYWWRSNLIPTYVSNSFELVLVTKASPVQQYSAKGLLKVLAEASHDLLQNIHAR